jgi:hypothetical protein
VFVELVRPLLKLRKNIFGLHTPLNITWCSNEAKIIFPFLSTHQYATKTPKVIFKKISEDWIKTSSSSLQNVQDKDEKSACSSIHIKEVPTFNSDDFECYPSAKEISMKTETSDPESTDTAHSLGM